MNLIRCNGLWPVSVRSNALTSGWIGTKLKDAFIQSHGDPEEFRGKIGAIHPMRRKGQPDDLGALVAWLASGSAGFITELIWTMDGRRMTLLSLP